MPLRSTLTTLKPLAGMAVQHHAVEDRGLSSVIKTRHDDLHLPLAAKLGGGVCAKRDSCVCGMPAGHDKVEHRVCAQRVVVCSAKVAMFNDPFWFQILSVCITVGQIRWSMVVRDHFEHVVGVLLLRNLLLEFLLDFLLVPERFGSWERLSLLRRSAVSTNRLRYHVSV